MIIIYRALGRMQQSGLLRSTLSGGFRSSLGCSAYRKLIGELAMMAMIAER